MGSMNRVILIGRLGRNPDDRRTSGGTPVANFSLATDQLRSANGERERITEWHRVVCFGKLAELSTQYLLKGRLVCVEGSLQTRCWEKSPGDKRYSTEIVASRLVFLDNRGRESQVSDRSDGESEFLSAS
jgi:single-strand DNA-binding protein